MRVRFNRSILTVAALAALTLGLSQPTHAAHLTFVGSATADPGGFLRLTPAAPGQAGAVWTASKRRVNLGFRTSFYFRIQNQGGIEGADGFAFVIQNAAANALGAAGGGIGYHGLPRSVAVEFDTYQNGFGGVSDPNANHVSIHTNGFGPNSVDEFFSVASTSLIPNLSDGAIHFVRIASVYGLMTVELDGVIVLNQMPVDLGPTLDSDGRAWFGFTSATGAGFETHDIDAWCLANF